MMHMFCLGFGFMLLATDVQCAHNVTHCDALCDSYNSYQAIESVAANIAKGIEAFEVYHNGYVLHYCLHSMHVACT